MKINHRTTALPLLLGNVKPSFSSDQQDHKMLSYFFGQEFQNSKLLFSQKIQYISKPFNDTFQKERSKISKLILKEEIQQSGTYIKPLPNGGTNTIFYSLNLLKKDNDWIISGTICYFFNTKQFEYPLLVGYIRITEENIESYFDRYAADHGGYSVDNCLSDLLSLILFTKYCKSETKIIEAGKKGYHIREKYVNETELPIEILDSTWFTTSINNNSFMVGEDTGGFLRLQPVGPGRKEIKLVWINPFEKKGYIRSSKLLNPQST